jgi:hypothetical protein
MGESSAHYITRLERENAAMAQRINVAVRKLDTTIARLSQDPPLKNYVERIQKDLRS